MLARLLRRVVREQLPHRYIFKIVLLLFLFSSACRAVGDSGWRRIGGGELAYELNDRVRSLDSLRIVPMISGTQTSRTSSEHRSIIV